MTVKVGPDPYLRAASAYIRYQVFVLERGIPAAEEFDAHDLPQTVYAVAFAGDHPLATARLLNASDNQVRITRVATLKTARGKSYGRQVVEALEQEIKAQNYKSIEIHAETDAIPFYEKLGYQINSEIYYEDGQPCQSVIKYVE